MRKVKLGQSWEGELPGASNVSKVRTWYCMCSVEAALAGLLIIVVKVKVEWSKEGAKEEGQ